ncbi:MAG: DUF2878 domain-containing protein [Planctomycetes bacterium]|nr:DUF2878 domain-containing protein [Planctomycetota bacterium]
MSASLRSLSAFALFQLAWFACVFAGRAGQPFLGPGAALVVRALHLGLLTRRGERRREALAIGVLGVSGLLADAGLVALGTVCFDDGSRPVLGLPLWYAALWLLFPILLDTSLRWLRGRSVWSIAFGALGGPLAVVAGERLGALRIGADRPLALAAIAALWAVYTPCAVAARQNAARIAAW